MLKLSVEGKTAEELLSNLLAAANAMSAGAGLALVSEKPKTPAADDRKPEHEEAKLPEEPETPAVDAKPTGRRGARRGGDKAPEEDSAGKGRRSRGAAKPDNLVDDNEEQAALRAQLITDLQDLADVEEAHSEVQDALKRVGAKSVKEVASASLGDFDADIQKILKARVNNATPLSDADSTQLKTDLVDLQDVIDNPGHDTDAADDVRDTLLDAWEAAGVKTDKPTEERNIKKLNSSNIDGFRKAVNGLLTKYFPE